LWQVEDAIVSASSFGASLGNSANPSHHRHSSQARSDCLRSAQQRKPYNESVFRRCDEEVKRTQFRLRRQAAPWFDGSLQRKGEGLTKHSLGYMLNDRYIDYRS
jgi:hypothetical protein